VFDAQWRRQRLVKDVHRYTGRLKAVCLVVVSLQVHSERKLEEVFLGEFYDQALRARIT
jgi:hypothetical protein